VAIANALHLRVLRPPETHHAKFEVDEPIHCRIIAFLLLIHYFTLWPWSSTPWPWPLTFDLEHLNFFVYRLWRDETMYQIWMQSINPRRSYSDFSIRPNDLERCVTYCARIWHNFHQVWPTITYPCLNYRVFMLIGCHTVTLTLDRLILKVRGISGVTWSKSVQNLSEMEQSASELLMISRFFHTLCHAVTLTFDLLTLYLYGTLIVVCLNCVQTMNEI